MAPRRPTRNRPAVARGSAEDRALEKHLMWAIQKEKIPRQRIVPIAVTTTMGNFSIFPMLQRSAICRYMPPYSLSTENPLGSFQVLQSPSAVKRKFNRQGIPR